MTLREESLSTKEQAPFASTGSMINAMQAERDNIQRLTDEFLRKGGRVTDATGVVIQQAKSKQRQQMDEKRKKTKNAINSKLTVQSPVGFFDGKNRVKERATSGHMNIQTKGDKHIVTIGKVGYGTFKDINEAIRVRDEARAALKMSRAAY